MHPFTDCIGLRILACQAHILNAEHFQSPLERTAYEFASLVMYTTYGSGITTKPALGELVMTVFGISLSTQISLTRLEAVSMQVKALNSTFLPLTLASQGPIRSMATSSQGETCTSLLGSSPYPWPGVLYIWQSWHFSCSMC